MSSIAGRLGRSMILGGGLLVAALFTVLDSVVDQQLYASLDHSLVERSRAFVALVAARDAQDRALVDSWPEFAATRHEDFYQVWDAEGAVLARAASNLGRDLARPPAPPGNTPALFDLSLPDGHRGRGVQLAAWRPGAARPWTVVLATEREATDALERRVHRVLLGGAVAALALMLLLSLSAVRRGLAPLRRFGENAARRALAARAPASASDASLPQELAPIGASLDRAFAALSDAVVREQRFARAVAHELRTPLAEMGAVLEGFDGVAAAAPLAALRASLAAMTRTVDGLIALARYEAGLETPAIEPVELRGLLATLLRARDADIAARGLVLDLEGPGELWVSTDAALLERILANLLGNAIDHAPVGSRIALRAAQDDAGAVTITCSNAAPALDAKDVNQFGERYFHPAGATVDRRHVGLGLALSQAIATQLGLVLGFELGDGTLRARLTGLRAI